MNTEPLVRRGAEAPAANPAATPLDQLLDLRERICARAGQDLARFRACYPDGSPTDSARNLASYLALRRFDLRSLQETLAATGISSLGRCESRVMPMLDRIISLLGGNQSSLSSNDETLRSYTAGTRQLAANTERIFGHRGTKRETRIMVTLPSEGAGDYRLIRDLVEAGMDCARINCAHDDAATWAELVAHVRRAARETGKDCRIMMDLAGHKLRTGPMQSIPGVVHIRVRRDRYGRMLAPARVVLSPRREKTCSRVQIDREDCLGLPISDALNRELQCGDRLEFRDTRGKHRHFTICERMADDHWLAECPQNAWLSGETLLRHLRPLPEGGYRQLEHLEIPDIPADEAELRLRVGDNLLISADTVAGSPAHEGLAAVISCTHAAVLRRLTAGQKAWFDDGKIGGVVERVDSDGVLIRITDARPQGALLRADKGINFPGADLGLSGLSAKDLADLDFVIAHADIIGYSFVETLADMERLFEEIERRNATGMPVIAKIETRRAVVNLPELLLGSIGRCPLGIMIARGDLAVEIGGERLSEIQEEILWLCEAAHVPSIWATQVLESMTKKGVVNRAELTDAAMSGRAECVMLNKGPFVLKSLRTLADILSRIRDHQYKKFSLYRALHW